MKNQKKLILIICIVLVLAVVGILIFNALKPEKNDENKGNTNQNEVVKEELTTIMISINPKLVFEINKDNNIVNMYPLNEDAKKFNREDYIGKTMEESINTLLDDAKDYLKKNKQVTISVVNGKEEKLTQIEEIISEKQQDLKIVKEQMTEKNKEEIINQVEQIKNDNQQESKPEEPESPKEEQSSTDKKEENAENKKDEEDKKEEVKSKNNNLSSLTVDKVSITFNKNTTTYKGIVAYNVSAINITAKAEDSKAKISGTGNKKLNVGANNISVKVTAEDGTTKTYSINIERRPEYNLNDNITVLESGGTTVSSYVYPTNPECIGKSPWDMTIPEGDTYDNYCKNNILTNYPKISGKAYVCEITESPVFSLSEPGMTASKPYYCSWIDGVANETEMNDKVKKVLQVGNYFELGGGMGGADEVKLTEALCTKYSLTCGRW